MEKRQVKTIEQLLQLFQFIILFAIIIPGFNQLSSSLDEWTINLSEFR